MANSMVLDAFQLAQGDFLSRYGLSNLSTFDYIKLRGMLAAAPHSTVLASGTMSATATRTTGLAGTVITGMILHVAGTDIIGVVTIGGVTNFEYSMSNVTGFSAWADLTLRDVELPGVTGITFTLASGSGLTFSYMLFGYTPPTSQP